MGSDFTMTRAVFAKVLAQAAAAHPNECCGVLLGAADGEPAHVTAILPARNIAPAPQRHFEIDPAVLIGAYRAERAGGDRIIGWYHSHPGGAAQPSATDRACAAQDGKVWAIVAGGAITCWRDTREGFTALSTGLTDG